MESQAEIAALKAHLALYVNSVARSVDFYRKLFGIEPSKVRTGYAKFDVHDPPLNLTLNEAPNLGSGAISHLGIQVATTDDVLRMKMRWENSGLLTKDEMKTNCCYAIQDKTWVRDPDGNEWEAFVVLQDNLRASTSCCVTDAPVTIAASPAVSVRKAKAITIPREDEKQKESFDPVHRELCTQSDG